MTTVEGPLGEELPAGRPWPHTAHLSLASLSDVARARMAFAAVVIVAGLLYTWNLTVSGYANTYYSAAAQAASQSWSAWFFGSLDAANFITIDKPPLATWLMGLSVRIFGLSSWWILLPRGACRRRDRRAPLRDRPAVVRDGRGDDRGRCHGAHARRGPDLPLQQSGCAADVLLVSAAWALSRGLDAGRVRWAVAAAGPRRPRVPH